MPVRSIIYLTLSVIYSLLTLFVKQGILMKVGVISDTHLRSFAEFPRELIAVMSQVELIIHAGDIVTMDVIKGLETLAPVRAVSGNMDWPEVKVELPEKLIIEAGDRKIGVVHGFGGSWGIEDRVSKLFSGVDAIVFGHTHQPLNKLVNGVLFFNPGRASTSYGILEVAENIEGRIIENYV